MSLAEWMEEATPRRARVPVCFDGDLLSRLEDAKARAVQNEKVAMLGDEERLEALAEVTKLEAAVKEQTHVFVFASIGWGKWRDLVSKHPPRPDAEEVFSRAIQMKLLPIGFDDLETDETTFVPAVLVATCVEPGIPTPKDAMRLLETVPTGIVSRIWEGILKVNHGGKADPFVEGSIDFAEALATGKKQKRP
jgi:hypothetical protein